jgi:hypothetical protein
MVDMDGLELIGTVIRVGLESVQKNRGVEAAAESDP